jgi:hypothetical protein
LSNEKDPADADKDYVKYLVANPVLAKQALQNRTPIPGLTKKRQKSIYDALELEINDIDAADKALARPLQREHKKTQQLKKKKPRHWKTSARCAKPMRCNKKAATPQTLNASNH